MRGASIFLRAAKLARNERQLALYSLTWRKREGFNVIAGASQLQDLDMIGLLGYKHWRRVN